MAFRTSCTTCAISTCTTRATRSGTSPRWSSWSSSRPSCCGPPCIVRHPLGQDEEGGGSCYYLRSGNSPKPVPNPVGKRVDLMATTDLDLGRYALGWSDVEDYVFKPKKGLNRENVEEISYMKG